MPKIVGSAEVQVVPNTSAFGDALQRQLTPILERVGLQISRTLSVSLGAAGAQVGTQLGTNIAQSFQATAPAKLKAATERVTKSTGSAFQDAGQVSGKLFASGVGEGFAALAAFAIAARVKRFFTETVTAATDFESAFAGVRRTVDTTAEGFTNLRESILDLSTRLGFTATSIATVASESGRLGVAAQNIEGFTETILKLSIITGQAPEEVAGNLARFATVVQRSLGETEHFADVILKLDTASAASAAEIQQFAQRLAPLSVTMGISAENVLALATALRQAGVESEAGGTAVTQTINRLVGAATGANDKLVEFSTLLHLSTNEFRTLATSDPTTAFVRFIDALSASGLQAQTVLEDLGLGSVRISRGILALAASHEKLSEFIGLTAQATGELTRQSNIFLETPEQKLARLRQEFEKTRIEIGGKLLPSLIGILDPFAKLNTASVSLGAAFAGIAAGGFAFIRLKNILGAFGATFSGARLTQEGFTLALARAQQTGTSFGTVLGQLKTGALVYTPAVAGATAGTIALGNAQATAALKAVTFRTAFQEAFSANVLSRAAQPAVRLQAIGSAAVTAARSVGFLSLGLKGLGLAAAVVIGVDLLSQALDKLGDLVDKVFNLLPARAEEAHKFLLDAASGGTTLADALEKAGVNAKTLGAEIGASEGLKSLRGKVTREVSEIDKAFASLLSTAPTVAQNLFDQLVVLLDVPAEDVLKFFPAYSKALAEATNQTRGAGLEAAATGQNLDALGSSAAFAAGGVGRLSAAATAAKAALSGIASAQQAYQSRVESFLPRFGEFIIDTAKSGAAASKAARDTLSSARAIADAQRALADARRDANRSIADSERKLADAQTDAIKRVNDAQRRLNESRLDSRRRVRDAQEELQDFEAGLARVGGAQTAEDIIRLRELNEAVTDTLADSRRAEADGQRAVDDARAEGAKRTEDAQRALVRAEQEAAEKIADALRRLARAQEDAAKRGAAAAAAGGAATDSIIRTAAALENTFRVNAAQLNAHAKLIEEIAPKIEAAFGDRNFSDAFLARLAELGPASIPLLTSISRLTEAQLKKGLVPAFRNSIRAAKREADLQFTRFPPNFERAIRPAVEAIDKQVREAAGKFAIFGDSSAEATAEIETNLNDAAAQLALFVTASGVKLSQAQTGFLALAQSTAPVEDRLKALRTLLNSLKSVNLSVKGNFDDFDKAIKENLRKLEERGFKLKILPDGSLAFRLPGGGVIAAQGATVFGNRTAQGGASVPINTPILVGKHTAEELFIPNQAGAIFRHTDTLRILAALKLSSRGGTQQTIIVNEVAQDPRATARAVSFAVGSGAVR